MAANRDAPLTLGPWPAGIVNTVDKYSLPKGALFDALDHNIDREGSVSARNTYTLIDAAAYADIFEHGGTTYAVSAGSVGVVGLSSFTAIRAITGKVGWTDLNGIPAFCDYDGVYVIEDLTSRQLVNRPVIEDEARYGLATMPGGHKIAYWFGRLLVLRGRSLLWSEPLDYGSHSPARNFIRFPTNPTWMAPVAGGVFVGLKEEVVFLHGTDPAEFKMRTVSGPSSPGASLVVDNKYFSDETFGQGDLAVWFGENGFVVGRADGSVVYPQVDMIRGLTVVPRNLAIIGERLYAFTTEE